MASESARTTAPAFAPSSTSAAVTTPPFPILVLYFTPLRMTRSGWLEQKEPALMPRQKTDLQKHTLNLRPGDFTKIGCIFPHLHATTIIRLLISTYVDNNYKKAPSINTQTPEELHDE